MRTRRESTPRARKPAGLSALTPRLRAGRMTADEFFKATADDFVRLAARLRRGYDLPAAVDLDDVAQELRLQYVAALTKWDPMRGVDLAKFATIKAHFGVRKWLDAQRDDGADGRSRYPLLLIDAVEREEADAMTGGAVWAGRFEAPDRAYERQEAAEDLRLLGESIGITAVELGDAVGTEKIRDRLVREAAFLGIGFEDGKMIEGA